MSLKLNHREVEKFLIDNPDFLKSWLKVHGTPDLSGYRSGSQSEPSSPEIKIKRLPKFGSQGNSITSSIFRKYVEGNLSRIKKTSQDRQALLRMSEEEVFMELIRDIATELDVNVLCHKILKNVSILTRSDRGSLFLVRGSKDQRCLVSKLFDVTESSTMEETLHTEDTEIKVPFGVGIAGHVAETKETINIKDAYQDPRFNKEIDLKTGYTTHSVLCMPILNYYGEVIGVAQIINKVTGNHEFTKADEEVFRRYLIFCGIGLTNAQLFEMSVQEYQRNQLLLSLARGVFEEQQSLERLVQKIMVDAQGVLKCMRCSVYLIEDSFSGEGNRFTGMFAKIVQQYNNKQLAWSMFKDPIAEHNTKLEEMKKVQSTKDVVFSRVFELYAKDGKNIHVPSAADVAKSQNAEIARHVVIAGKPFNLSREEILEILRKGPFHEDDGFKTQNILCMPIFNSEKNIIGVMQLMNKLNGALFNENDANIIEAFSIFTGLGIHNCQMYENACRLMAKQTVALEVLSYHACAQSEETEKFLQNDCPKGEEVGLYSFAFNDMTLSEDDTVRCVITMFTESNLVNKFRIPNDVIYRWTLSVKKNYRPVTYHNWRHAFNVVQTMFTMLYSGGLLAKFHELEVLALLVACLCHDLDHRGTNNDFQVKVASPLAMLYSTSVMEHHHFDHCIMILNSEGNNIFQSLSSEDYRKVIKMLEHAILSTDLALYFKKRGDFKKLVDAGETEYQEPHKKDLLKAMMMTACDVAAITKPWEIQKEVAQLVANEFFEQGDIEKTKLGKKPIAMMDREKKDELPKMQVGFIDAICLPIYETLSDQWRGLTPMLDGCMKNRQKWKELADSKSTAADDSNQPGITNTKHKGSISSKDEIGKQGKRKSLNKDSPVKMKKTVTLDIPKKTKICTVL